MGFENALVIWFMVSIYGAENSQLKKIERQLNHGPFYCSLIKIQLGQLFRFQWPIRSAYIEMWLYRV